MNSSSFGPLSYRAKLMADDSKIGMLREEIKRKILFAARGGKYSVTINNLDKFSPHDKHLVEEWLDHEEFNFTEDEMRHSLIITWNK